MLLNLRIGPKEEKIVKGLRRAKVNVSALLRKAIRDAAPQEKKPKSRAQELKEVYKEWPTEPSERVGASVDLTNRYAMHEHILRVLRRK